MSSSTATLLTELVAVAVVVCLYVMGGGWGWRCVVSEIEDLLPMEQPKESKKAGKQMAKLIKEKEAEEKRRAEEQMLADQQVALLGCCGVGRGLEGEKGLGCWVWAGG